MNWDKLIEQLVGLAERLLPVVLWDILLRKMNELQNEKLIAILEKKHAENALKVEQNNAHKSDHDVVYDIFNRSDGTDKHD